MSSPHLRLATALATGLALAAAPAPAAAAPTTPVGTACAAPTSATCSAPTLDGRACRARFPDACRALLVDAATAATGAWPTVSMPRPPGTSAPYTVAQGVRISSPAPQVARVVGGGTDLLSSVARKVQQYQVAAAQPLGSAAAAVACYRAAWASDRGQRSCPEYAFERFPRLGELEARIDARQGQVSALLDELNGLAFMRAEPLVNDPASVHVDAQRLRHLGPVTVGQYLRYQRTAAGPILVERTPARYPKNTFAAYAAAFLARLDLGMRGAGEPGNAVQPGAIGRLDERPHPAVTPADLRLQLLLLQGATQELTLERQVAIRDALRAAGHSEATQRQLAVLQEAFARTWQKRQEVEAGYYSMRLETCYSQRAVDLNSSLTLIDFTCNPFDLSWPPFLKAKALLADYDAQLVGMLRAAAAFGCLSPTSPSACDWNPDLAYQTLLTGRPLAHDALPAPAGWNLSGGVAEFQRHRAAEQARCARLTKGTPGLCVGGVSGGSLAPLDFFYDCTATPRRPLYDFAAPAQVAQWPAGEALVSNYLVEAEETLALIEALMDKVRSGAIPTTSRSEGRTVGQQWSGSEGLYLSLPLVGGETGGGYDYRAGWWLSGVNPRHPGWTVAGCPAGAAAELDFGMDSKLLGTSLARFRFSGAVNSDPIGRVFAVRIDDQDLAGHPWPNAGPIAEHFDLAAHRTFFQNATTIPVAGLPVTLAFSVVGEAGVRLGAGYGDRECTNAPIAFLEASQHFEPTAQLRLLASAAINLGAVQAGVEGQLTLVSVGLPLRVDSTLTKAAAEEPVIATSGSVALTAGTLSGTLGAFVEFEPFGPKLKQTILGWDGLAATQTLAKVSLDLPVVSMGLALGAGSCGAPP